MARPLGTSPAVLCFFTSLTETTGMATCRSTQRNNNVRTQTCVTEKHLFHVHVYFRVMLFHVLSVSIKRLTLPVKSNVREESYI